MEKLTIEDIAKILVEKNGLSQQAAENFAKQMFSVVQDAVEREKLVKVKGLGAFKIVDVEARESINVNNGERVLIEGHGKISFTPDATMKELVNKPFSQFETVVLNEGVSFDEMPPDEPDNDEEEEQPQQEQQQEETRQREQQQETRQREQQEEETRQQEQQQEETRQEEQQQEETRQKEQQEETRQKEQQEEEEPEENPAESTNARTFEQSSNRTLDNSSNRAIGQSNNRPQEAALETAPQEAAPQEAALEAAPQEESSPLQQDEPEAAGHEDDEDNENSDTTKWIVFAVISLVLMALAACAGYIYGLNKGRAEARAIQDETQAEKPKAEPQSKDSLLAALHPEEPVVLEDSTKAKAEDDTKSKAEEAKSKAEEAKSKAEEAKSKAEEAAKAKAEEAAKAKAEAAKKKAEQAASKTTNSKENSDKYEKMDARVRTGAYRIVGVDRTITVRKGETVKRISKTYLGDGMECYVEVLNGLTSNAELKEGSKLKIPKLELKKRGK